MELLGALLVEFLVPFVLEFLGWLGMEVLAALVFEKPLQAVTLAGAPLLGAALAWLSLVPFPHHLLQDPQLVVLNLCVAPMVAAFAGGTMGLWLHPERGLGRTAISALASALFVLAFALVRWGYAA